MVGGRELRSVGPRKEKDLSPYDALRHNNLTLVFYHAYDNKLETFAFGKYTPHLKKRSGSSIAVNFGDFFMWIATPPICWGSFDLQHSID
jgi:hypothetical protein